MEEKQIKQLSCPPKISQVLEIENGQKEEERTTYLNLGSCIWTWTDPKDLHLCIIIHLLLGS